MIKLNGSPVNTTLFPDNTTQVWKVDNISGYNVITWDFLHEGEFMQLAQLKTLLDSQNVHSKLVISYLPYGRQDKAVSNNATFALTTFANLLNSLKFSSIEITDPHSNVALSLINNSTAIYPTDLWSVVLKQTESTIVCYPDKGALTKYTKIKQFPHIYGEKQRDQQTGYIGSYELVLNGQDIKNKNVLIIDDICDGGLTFTMLADSLKKEGVKEVNLFVSHGVFSKGLGPLFASGITNIFTKDGKAFEVNNTIAYKEVL